VWRVKRARSNERTLLSGLQLSLVVTAWGSAMPAWGSAMTSPRISGGVFSGSVMAGVADVAMPVLRLVSVEMGERLFPAGREWSVVAVTRIVAVVDMAIKPVRTVKPWPGPDKHTPDKPIRPIVAIGSTLIGSKVEVAIGAHRCHPDVDGYLRRCTRKAAQHGRSESKKRKKS
jgi:hypothetical protein